MRRIYFDTETDGFPQKSGSPLDRQPHIVQLAAILVDDDEGEVASINFIIKPDGWTISEEVSAIHGISTEKAEKFGVPIVVAMSAFSNLLRVSDEVVAHNIDFDRKLVAYEFERLGKPNLVETLPQYCTMKSTTTLCKLPGKYGTYKWPKLIEAYTHLFGEGFDGAHDALVDVRACRRVHAELLKNLP